MSQGTLGRVGQAEPSVTHLDNVIIKQQPEAVTLHYGDVMPPIWPTEKTNRNLPRTDVQ